jgi:hypothetical protein
MELRVIQQADILLQEILVIQFIQVLIMDSHGLHDYRVAFHQETGVASQVIQQASSLLQVIPIMDLSTQVLIMESYGLHALVQEQDTGMASLVIQQASSLLQGIIIMAPSTQVLIME